MDPPPLNTRAHFCIHQPPREAPRTWRFPHHPILPSLPGRTQALTLSWSPTLLFPLEPHLALWAQGPTSSPTGAAGRDSDGAGHLPSLTHRRVCAVASQTWLAPLTQL